MAFGCNVLRLASTLAVLGGALLAPGCTTPPSGAAMTTGTVVSRGELVQAIGRARSGDDRYAVVNSAWLRDYQPRFRAELHRLGVIGWSPAYDCNRFAGFYVELAKVLFYAAQFPARPPGRAPAQAPALAAYWFTRDGGGRHAVVVALTERGPVFIEPQTGAEVRLSAREQASAFAPVF